MKKTIVKLFITSLLFTTANAEIFTGTSVAAGLTDDGSHIRIDQYVGSSEYSWVYGKIGVSQESNPLGDSTMGEDYVNSDQLNTDVTSLIVGIGVNVFSYKGFFMDVSGDYYLALNAEDKKGTKVYRADGLGYEEITNTMDLNTFSAEVGLGYSFGNWSLRLDAIFPFTEYEYNFKNSVTNAETTHTASRVTIGLGVTYWY